MSVRYGFNILSSDIKKMLEENERQQSGIRSWKQLFGNAALGYNAQSDALRTDYSSYIADAYAANFKQRNAILGAGYNQGATSSFLTDNRNDLLSAYDTYVKNYDKNATALAEAYTEEVNTYDKALDERAKNFASLYNKAYDYLTQELYGAYQTLNDGTTIDYLKDQGLHDYVFDENTGLLKSWTDLSYSLFDTDRGGLTQTGKDFYNRIFNDIPQNWLRDDEKSETGYRSMRGFDEWLSDVDPALREWWISQDDFNYTSGGRNKDSADKLIGIDGMQAPSSKPNSSDIVAPGERPRWAEGSNVEWSIRGLGTGKETGSGKSDDFRLLLNPRFYENGETWADENTRTVKMTTLDNVDENLSKELNYFATGGENTSPSTESENWLGGWDEITSKVSGKQNKIVVYKGKMYIYTKNGWREAVSRDESVSTQSIIDAFLKKSEPKSEPNKNPRLRR